MKNKYSDSVFSCNTPESDYYLKSSWVWNDKIFTFHQKVWIPLRLDSISVKGLPKSWLDFEWANRRHSWGSSLTSPAAVFTICSGLLFCSRPVWCQVQLFLNPDHPDCPWKTFGMALGSFLMSQHFSSLLNKTRENSFFMCLISGVSQWLLFFWKFLLENLTLTQSDHR